MTIQSDASIYLRFVMNILFENEEQDIKNITKLDSFRDFRKQNLISFADAREVDNIIFGHSGSYWISAYSYPEEGQEIERDNIVIGKAKNVGLLTFDIEY
jgi:hypothetical protein